MKIKEKALFLWNNRHPFLFSPDFSRYYIGEEFCERRLPAIEDLEAIFLQSREKDLKVTLVTPFLTNLGIEKVNRILDFIVEKNLNLKEIVINDWGALKLLKNYGERFQIVLGRLLVSRYSKKVHSEEMLLRYSQNKNRIRFDCLFPDSFLDFMKKENIFCLEFNSYYHLALCREQLTENGFRVHIYFPFIYLTTTRYCSCVDGYNSYFRNSITGCHRDCEEYIAEFASKRGVFIKGNTYFIKQRASLIERFNFEVDRIICNDFINPIFKDPFE